MHQSLFIFLSKINEYVIYGDNKRRPHFSPRKVNLKKSKYVIYGDKEQRPLDQQAQQVILNDTNRSLVFDWLLLMLVFYLSLDCPWWLWLNLIDCVWWLIDCIFYCVFDCLWCLFLIEFLIVFKESIKLFKLVSCFKKTISNLENEILKLKFEIENWNLKS